ncbi:MAG TPA: AtpZ/AtpI family protein [Planctomycetota bacterium]|nr:AtpZ/AtpI family protein [Planctomycetota bacterium]
MADDSPRPLGKDGKKQDQNDFGLLGSGLQLAGAVLFFLALGWWLDSRLGTFPWLMAGGGTLGLVTGLYRFVKDAMK